MIRTNPDDQPALLDAQPVRHAAFGGMVRIKQYKSEELHERLVLKSTDTGFNR